MSFEILYEVQITSYWLKINNKSYKYFQRFVLRHQIVFWISTLCISIFQYLEIISIKEKLNQMNFPICIRIIKIHLTNLI